MPLFHSHSTNISPIANLNAGGDRARNTTQSAYSSSYDMIRTPILNRCQSCRNCKLGTVVEFQPGQKPTVLCPVRVTDPPRQTVSGFRTSLQLKRTVHPVHTRPAGGSPGPVADTNQYIFQWCNFDTSAYTVDINFSHIMYLLWYEVNNNYSEQCWRCKRWASCAFCHWLAADSRLKMFAESLTYQPWRGWYDRVSSIQSSPVHQLLYLSIYQMWLT